MTPREPSATIHGYVTDPHQVGYQSLTNYESTFWRRLVGRDAWSLYEVLRSFCHSGNNTCHVRVNTLIEILGLSDRRQLIGRVTKTRGKERTYPGLIDVLQEHNLVFAEVVGSGPTLRYQFHVTLKPPALTAEQVAQLPSALQRRHQGLLDRVARSMQAFENIRSKPLKQPKQRGSGTPPHPPGTEPNEGGTPPPKQQPENSTHSAATTEGSQNDESVQSMNESEQAVVALIEQGISERDAHRLAERYPSARILEKIEQLPFRNPTKNAAGLLRRSIEEDWAAPSGYKTPEQREAEAKEVERQEAERQRLAQRVNAQQQRQLEQQQIEADRRLARVRQHYHTSSREAQVWAAVLDTLQSQLSELEFMLVKGAALLTITDERAVLALPHSFAIKQFEKIRLQLIDALAPHVAGHQVVLEFVNLQSADAAAGR